MPDRIQITAPTYMKIDNQWTIAEPGSVVDVPSVAGFKNHAPVAETASAIPTGHGAVSVRNVRKR